MGTKTDLISKIVRELRRAQVVRWQAPNPGPVKTLSFPPSLPLPDGKQLRATEDLLDAIYSYAELELRNDPSLRPRFKIEEFVVLAQRAFGEVLASIDLDETDEALLVFVREEVSERLNDQIQSYNRQLTLFWGCDVFEGDEPYPIRIGPVTFEAREQWRQRALDEGKISVTTARRLAGHWNGLRLRKRKPSLDEHAEADIVAAIGECPIVCVVQTDGLSSKYAREKGLLAARLAMTAVALMWSHPSEGLRWMNLLYDRRVPHRVTVLFSEGRYVSNARELSQLPSGRWAEPELIANLQSYDKIFAQVGEALASYVRPTMHTARPRLMKALLLSLLWFHEACREPLDQIATTKFAASMDALVVGQGAHSILQLINARLKKDPNDQLFVNGVTAKAAIMQIYNEGRSRLIHGSSGDFSHDWTQTRSMAEAIGRQCLVTACIWMTDNPAIDDLSALSGA